MQQLWRLMRESKASGERNSIFLAFAREVEEIKKRQANSRECNVRSAPREPHYKIG